MEKEKKKEKKKPVELINKDLKDQDWYQEILFKQYKLISDKIENFINSRWDTNTLFITLNGFIITGFAILLTNGFKEANYILLLGAIINFAWLLNNYAFNRRTQPRYDIAKDIEEYLPVRFFQREYELMTTREDNHKSKLPKFMFSKLNLISNSEKILIWVFILSYTIIFFLNILNI